jgi:hypothetical protein
VPWRELLLVGFVLYLLVAEVVTSNRSSLQSLVFTLFGYVWISWGFGLIITLRYTPDGVTGLWYLTFPMLAIIATDAGGYIFGSLWGRRPLAPRISPKKTVEGLIGGQLLALVVVGGTMALLPLWTDFRLDVAHLLVFGRRGAAGGARRRPVRVAGQALGGREGHGRVPPRPRRRARPHRQHADRGAGHLRARHAAAAVGRRRAPRRAGGSTRPGC